MAHVAVASSEVEAGARSEARAGAEAQLAALARAGGALRRVVAALARRLVEKRGFERLGYARLSNYARERLGVSARSLQELARVGARLGELPRLEGALVSGRLPWSKVRLLARFATPFDEARWIARAESVSVRGLERELRAVSRGAMAADEEVVDEEGAAVEALERVEVRGPIALAFKWQRTRRHVEKLAGETTPAARVLEWVTAEVLASGVAGEDHMECGGDDDGPESIGTGLEALGNARVANVCATQGVGEVPAAPEECPLPAFLQPLLAGLEGADAFELDARLRRAMRLEQRLDAELAPLLRVVASSEHEWRARYRTLAAFAREALGMSPRKARALLRLERVGERCPALREAYRAGALSWVQAQQLARLVGPGSEADHGPLPAWVDWAQGVTVRKLEETVTRALLWRDTDPNGHLPEPERVAAASRDEPDEERQMCARPTDPAGSLGPRDGETPTDMRVGIRVTAPRQVAQAFRQVLCAVRLALERATGRLPSEAEGFEALIDHALRAWQVDDRWLQHHSRRRLEVFERDDWRCAVPGCTSRRNLHQHHIRFRSAGGSDAPENRTTLCAFHHQRGVHGGTLRIRGQAPDDLVFELGIRPGQPPLARFRSGDRVA